MRAGSVRGSVPWPAVAKVARAHIHSGFRSLMGDPVTMLPPRLAVLRICATKHEITRPRSLDLSSSGFRSLMGLTVTMLPPRACGVAGLRNKVAIDEVACRANPHRGPGAASLMGDCVPVVHRPVLQRTPNVAN